MIPVKYIFDSVTQDKASAPEHGDLRFASFNRMSRQAELKCIDFLTGDVEGIRPPFMYTTQKLKSWVSFLIAKKEGIVDNGLFEKPEDYYRYENMYNITPTSDDFDCDTVDFRIVNTKIDIVNGAEFSDRMGSYILGVKPDIKHPIAKEIGNSFEIAPSQVGAVYLEYIRYPKFAEVKTKQDNVYNDLEIDELTSTNYEWPEYASSLLIWFITNEYAVNKREESLIALNRGAGMLSRDNRQ